MFAQERYSLILDLLRDQQRITTCDLSRRLKVSSATLRRDLAQLDRDGKVLRVHGGILSRDAATVEPSLAQKAGVAVAAKRRIATRVAAEIPDGATVFVDGGTTCLEAGLRLRKRADLVIVTNSLPLIAAYDGFAAKLIVPGGEHRTVSGALVGTMAVEAVSRLRADFALVGASGLHPEDGASTTELLEAGIKQEWIRRARNVFLLADHSKWHESSTVCFADWSEIPTFYTDKKPPGEFEPRNTRIVIA